MKSAEALSAPILANKTELLADFRLASESRHASLLGRKEVFMGKAKFGIFGDGKELAQIALAKVFRPGDFRSGYYRDQTFMVAAGMLTWQQYFAQLYAHADVQAEPASGGRLMNGHFSTRLLDESGAWLSQTERKNSSSDVSPTGSQMPRLLGLAYASKLYRLLPELAGFPQFSHKGNEVAFGTIGNASTSEGMFYEAINAAGVLQVPIVMSVWDDEYGISVGKEHHTTKGSISEALAGFQRTPDQPGWEIIRVKGWDYLALTEAYQKAARLARQEHVPVLVHVIECTQPQGHSTSGSHERYKSAERLAWESEYDCIAQFRQWLESEGVASPTELDQIDKEAQETAKQARSEAWNAFADSVKEVVSEALSALDAARHAALDKAPVQALHEELAKTLNPIRSDAAKSVRRALVALRKEPLAARRPLLDWKKRFDSQHAERFNSYLRSQSAQRAEAIPTIPAQYSENSQLVDGREVVRACFDALFARDARVFALGEDVGKIGDVNQGFAGLQEKYGEWRISDTSIREVTIVGQGIGAALRGLRPIAEIQYLDYLNYALQILSDDVASLQYRTAGGQKAPLIIRTRGHRLEGMWHSGSPMGMILHSLRGMLVLTPRNMTQAAGFYNTLIESDEPALVIECLNGYRLKERMPDNIAEFKVPVGQVEVLRPGQDITLLTYGSMCRIALEAATLLADMGIEVEVIDAQSLLPFDHAHETVASLKKTNRLLVADEDVPSGASAYLLQQVLEVQGGYRWLDSAPKTVTAQEHRPPYGSDGDYFSKPSVEDLLEACYALMHEATPGQFPDYSS